MAMRSRSLVALGLWASSFWQPLAAPDGIIAPQQSSVPVILTTTSWSPLPTPSTLSVATAPSSGILATTTSVSATDNDGPSNPLTGNSVAGGSHSSYSTLSSQSVIGATGSPGIPAATTHVASTGNSNPSTPLLGTPVAGSSSSSLPAVSGSASTPVSPVAIIPATASSSASAFSTDVVGLYPIIQSWVKTPDPPQATAVVNAIKEKNPPHDESCENKEQKIGSLDDDTECAGFWLWKIKSNVEDTTKNDDNEEDKVKDVNNILEDKVKPKLDDLGTILAKPPGINPKPPGPPNPPGPPGGPDDPDTNSPDDPDDPTTSPSPSPTTTSTSTPSSTNPTNTPTSTKTSKTPLCSKDCAACRGDSDLPSPPAAKQASGSRKRTLPQPAPGEDNLVWFKDQVVQATKLPHVVDPFPESSAFLLAFEDEPFQTALVNLYGCTAVILISKQGMYMGHFWEGHGFLQSIPIEWDENGEVIDWVSWFEQEVFEDSVINRLSSGLIIDEGGWNTGGVQSPYFQDVGAEPQALIITPYEFGTTDIKYPDQVSQIRNNLTSVIPGLPPPMVHGYINPGSKDPAIENSAVVSEAAWTFGKVLLSYDPFHALEWEDAGPDGNTRCAGIQAGVDIRIGDTPEIAIDGKRWKATPRQQGLRRRDSEPVCSRLASDVASGTPIAASTAGGAAGTIAGSGAASTLVTSAVPPGELPPGGVPGSTAASPRPSTLVTSAVPSGVSYAGLPSSTSDGAGCVPTSGPDMDETKCICPVGSNSHRILPTLPSTDDLCGYEHLPGPASTAPASTTPASPSRSTSTPPITPSASTPAPTPSQYCGHKADPHNSQGNVCECSSTSDGTVLHTTLPLDREGGCDLYTTYPAPPDFPFTTTNAAGSVLAYQSSTLSYFRHGTTTNTYTFGAGPSKVLDAPTPTQPFTTTDAGDTVIAYASATLDYVNAGGAVHTYSRGAGPSTIISTPTPQAQCAFWTHVGFDYLFVIYDINYWDVDFDELASTLKHEEKGCGAMTAWDYSEHTFAGPAAKFRLPTLIKEGCVERAIRSAGGPPASDIACDPSGLLFSSPSDSVEDVLHHLYPVEYSE
ncbi:hypothetical protein BDW62DRAFT_199647 [Aspergillus aurantiobrunneus]